MIKEIQSLLVGDENKEDLNRYARMVALYGISMVANGVRCEVLIPNDNKSMPINIYAIGLGKSGLGKTKSLNFVMDLVGKSLNIIKDKTSSKLEMLDPFNTEEIGDLTKDGVTISNNYKSITDSSTLKLMRVMDITGYYSINYTVDEFASVVMKEYEMLSSTVIEIYDKGKVPVNLRATTKTSKCDNPVPFNMLAFGSPHLLFEGDSNIEKAFLDLLQAGMARRSLFVNAQTSVNEFILDANANRSRITAIEDKFISLQDKYDHKVLSLSDKAVSLYNEYLQSNTKDSLEISEFNQLKKIYAKNRSWIALKLSGIIACSNFNDKVEEEDYRFAMNIVDDSYEDLISILERPEKFELIVDWLLEQEQAESEYTMTQTLPFYKEVKSKKQFWELCKGYAYQNNITLMIEDRHNLTFYQARAKKKTNLDEPILFSYSEHITEGYFTNDEMLWKDFHKVVSKKGICYSAHGFKDGYRNKENAVVGFDLLILDIDEGTPLEIAKLVLENYTYMIATTKSHQKDKNGEVCDRYRIVLPMKNRLELDAEQYSRFMSNIMDDLPIETDNACKDISRFYYSADCEHWYNEGELFDGDKYIPNTQEQENYVKEGGKLARKNISGISQYIIRNEGNGRNNNLAKLALLLMDNGYTHEECKAEILRVNKQFQSPLSEAEVQRTVFKTISRKEEVEVEDEDIYEEEDEFATIDR